MIRKIKRYLAVLCSIFSIVLLFFKADKLLGASHHPHEIFGMIISSRFISVSTAPGFKEPYLLMLLTNF